MNKLFIGIAVGAIAVIACIVYWVNQIDIGF